MTAKGSMDQAVYLKINTYALGRTKVVKGLVKVTVGDHWCVNTMTEHGYFMELPALDLNHVG